MGPSDLTTDLGVLSPTTSVDAADRRSSHSQPEAERKRRQRARTQNEDDEDNENKVADDLAMEDGHDTPHQLDHLA